MWIRYQYGEALVLLFQDSGIPLAYACGERKTNEAIIYPIHRPMICAAHQETDMGWVE